MSDDQEEMIAEKMTDWCNHCQLYAVKFFIMNAEKEHIEQVISEAFETLPGKVGMDEWPSSVRKSLGTLSHFYLQDIETQIGLMLEAPCKDDLCKKECHQQGGDK
jgi:hypothetical protein